jgi:hypothetical protein
MKFNWFVIAGLSFGVAAIAGLVVTTFLSGGSTGTCSIDMASTLEVTPNCGGYVPMFSSSLVVFSTLSAIAGAVLVLIGYYGVDE